MEDTKAAIASIGVMAPSAIIVLEIILIARGFIVGEAASTEHLIGLLVDNLAILVLAVLSLWGRVKAQLKIGGIFTA